jgi:hypothetical protein
MKKILLPFAVAALILGLVFGTLGFRLITGAHAQTTVLGPVTTTVSVTASATMAALPANPTRRAVTICNGSATLIITFTTGSVTPVSLTTGVVIPTGNLVTSCYTIGIPGSGLGGAAVGNQINVIANGAGPTNVTFLEYF